MNRYTVLITFLKALSKCRSKRDVKFLIEFYKRYKQVKRDIEKLYE